MCEAEEKKRTPKTHMDWAELERTRSPHLLKKGVLSCRKKLHYFVTDDNAEYSQLVQSAEKPSSIIMTDRKMADEYEGCKNSSDCWSFESLELQAARPNPLQDDYFLRQQFMPCFCRNCQILRKRTLGETNLVGPVRCQYRGEGPQREQGKTNLSVSKIRLHRHPGVVPDVQLMSWMGDTAAGGPSDRELLFQCRSRGIGVSGSKATKRSKLKAYLEKTAQSDADVAASLTPNI
mmetsp:Transcript_21715/g.47338  ORF Transcript_21715/g.47338 Transcript_21715/m.47338 type:complete len:234 (+) Transcript_21715:2415-3116(+)